MAQKSVFRLVADIMSYGSAALQSTRNESKDVVKWILVLLAVQLGIGVAASDSTWALVFVPLAVVMALVTVLSPRIGLFLLVPTLFFQVDLPGRIGTYPADLLTLIALVGLLLHVTLSQEARFWENPLLLPMLAVLSVFGLSLWGAHNVGAGALNWLRHVEMFGLIMVTATVLDRRDVYRVLRLLLGITVIMSVLNIVEAIQIGGRNRVFGVAGAFFPFFALAAFVQCVVGYLLNPRLLVRFIWIGLAGVLGIAIIASQTREAMLQLAIALTVVCLLVWLWSKRAGVRAPRRRVIVLVVLGVIVVAVFFSGAVSLFDASSNRVTQALEGRSNTIFIRLFLWRTGLHAFLDSPIIGTGLGQVAQWDQILPYWRLDQMAAFSRGLGAHNDLVTYASETGILGLTVLFWFFWRLAKTGSRAWRREGRSSDPGALVVLWAVCLSLSIRFLFGTHTFYSLGGLFNCLYFGMLIAYAESGTSANDPAISAPTGMQ